MVLKKIYESEKFQWIQITEVLNIARIAMNQLDRRNTPTEKLAKDRNKLSVSIMFNFTVNQQNTNEKNP